MIYLDTSALAKMLVEEVESVALDTWLEEHPGALFTSALAEVELGLALHHRGRPTAWAAEILRGVARMEIDATVRERAVTIGWTGLRSLDAIHLASAIELDELVAGSMSLVTYDRRMATAARASGLAVHSPA